MSPPLLIETRRAKQFNSPLMARAGGKGQLRFVDQLLWDVSHHHCWQKQGKSNSSTTPQRAGWVRGTGVIEDGGGGGGRGENRALISHCGVCRSLCWWRRRRPSGSTAPSEGCMSCAPGEPGKGYGSCAVSMRSVAAISLGSIYI